MPGSGLSSSRMRACVSIPRSATTTTERSPKRPAELLDLAAHCGGVRSVALEDLDRDGAALTVAQQAEDDLQRAPFSVSGIPPTGQRTSPPFEVGRGDVVEH